MEAPGYGGAAVFHLDCRILGASNDFAGDGSRVLGEPVRQALAQRRAREVIGRLRKPDRPPVGFNRLSEEVDVKRLLRLERFACEPPRAIAVGSVQLVCFATRAAVCEISGST